jgi:hypothetical protein
MRRILYVLIIFGAVSCDVKVKDSDIFNGEIRIVSDTIKTVSELQSEEVVLDGITYGYPAIYDSLIFFYDGKTNRYYSIFNLKTGKHIGDFCPKGQGPGEARAISAISQFYIEGGELKTLLIAPHNFKLVIWNISKSIVENRTVWDFIPYDWRKDHVEIPHGYLYHLNDEEFIGNVQAVCMNPDEDCTVSTAPAYERRTVYTGTLVKKYTIFKQLLKHRGSNQLFDSNDCVKQDGSKVVQFMCYLPQINTIDIETGKVSGYRYEKSLDFSYLANLSESFEDFSRYFSLTTSNDKYIYVLYYNGVQDKNLKDAEVLVHVFDWDCNLLKKIKLLKDGFFHGFMVDEKNNFLYRYTINTDVEGETVCRYDLKSLGL